MDLLTTLAARAGVFTGRGVNHENEAFTARISVTPVMAGRALTLHYLATGIDGQHLHEEFTLLARAADQRLCLWPVMDELPFVMPHLQAGGVNLPGDELRSVFATGPRDAADQFREEIEIECTADGGLRYSHAWGLPGGAFAARSSCELQPSAG